jgi:protein ImuA
VLSEVFPVTAPDAGALGFVLACAPRKDAPIFWVQDRMSGRESGAPYMPAFPGRSIIRVSVSRPVDALWAMEEGLQSASLSMVIGEIWGDPAALTFTASKRLAFRAEAQKTPCWLIRRGAVPNLSSARNRWRISSLPSLPHPHDLHAPGVPQWRAELFRSRQMRTGTWVARYDPAADRIHFDAPLRDGAVGAGDDAARLRTA